MRLLSFIGSAAVLLTTLIASGTGIPNPHPRIITARSGYCAIKYIPVISDPTRPPACTLFSLDARGREHVLWRRRLINNPVTILIEDSPSPAVASIGDVYSHNPKHYVMIYSADGRVVADLDLFDILSTEEKGQVDPKRDVNTYVNAGSSEIGGQFLYLKMKSGRQIMISTVTGKVSPRSAMN